MGLENLSLDMIVRLYAFFIVLGTMVVWELFLPRRADIRRWPRWPSNFGIVIINSLMLIAIPVSAVAASLFSLQHKFGLFIWAEISLWPAILISFLVLELIIYWQHRIFHMFPFLWKIHRMHHTDTGFDVSTALRFHPVEILLSILIKVGVIILLGTPLLGVIIFEIVLNASAMFNHSNARLPNWVDKYLRLVIVTPDMHRVHHSIHNDEHNFNYGFFLPIWDRIFSSYKDQPRDGHEMMKIGLSIFNQPEESRLDKLLTQPFRSSQSSQPSQ